MAEFDCSTCAKTDRHMVVAAHRTLHDRGIFVKHGDAIAVVEAVVEVAQNGVKKQVMAPEPSDA